MDKKQIEFYKNTINKYKENVGKFSHSEIESLYNVVFAEIAVVKPDNLSLEHTELMEKCQDFFADNEDFDKAALLKRAREGAFKIFEARQDYLNKLKRNEKPDD